MPDISSYTREEIEDFVSQNLTIIGEKAEANADMIRIQFADILEALPPWQQVIVIERNSPNIIGDAEAINAEWAKRADPSNVYGFYSPKEDSVFWSFEAEGGSAQLTARHELGHQLSYLLGNEAGQAPQYYSTDPEWRQVVQQDISAHSFEKAPFRKLVSVIADKLGVNPQDLYPRARRLNEHLSLPSYQKNPAHSQPEEAMAEMTNHYDTLYEKYRGNEDLINRDLTKAYPKIWPAFRDRVIPLAQGVAEKLNAGRLMRTDTKLNSYVEAKTELAQTRLERTSPDELLNEARAIRDSQGVKGLESAITDIRTEQNLFSKFAGTVFEVEVELKNKPTGCFFGDGRNSYEGLAELYDDIKAHYGTEGIERFIAAFSHERRAAVLYARTAAEADMRLATHYDVEPLRSKDVDTFSFKTRDEIIKIAAAGGEDLLSQQTELLRKAQTLEDLVPKLPAKEPEPPVNITDGPGRIAIKEATDEGGGFLHRLIKAAKAARFAGIVPVIGIGAGLAGAGFTTSAHAAQRDYAQQLYEQGAFGEVEKALEALKAYNELSIKFNKLYGVDAAGGIVADIWTLGAAEAGTWFASIGIELQARKEFQQWADTYAPNLSDEQYQTLAMSLFSGNSARTEMILEAADNLPDNTKAADGIFNAAIEARNAYKRAYVEMTNENGRLAGKIKTPEEEHKIAQLEEATEQTRAAMIAEMEALMTNPANIDRFLDTVSPEDRLDYVRRLAASDAGQDALSQNHPKIAAYLKAYDGSWTGMWLDEDNVLLANPELLNAYIKERNGIQTDNDIQFAQIVSHMDKLAQGEAEPKLPELQALAELYKQDGTGPEFKSYLAELRSGEHWPDIMIELSELFPLRNTFSVANKPFSPTLAPEQVVQPDAST